MKVCCGELKEVGKICSQILFPSNLKKKKSPFDISKKELNNEKDHQSPV